MVGGWALSGSLAVAVGSNAWEEQRFVVFVSRFIVC